MSEPEDERPTRRSTRRKRLLAIVAVVVLAIGAMVVVSQLLAPSGPEIISKVAPTTSAWSRPGSITHFTTVTEQRNPETGEREKLRREHWVSADGTSQRVQTVRLGTPRTYASIYEPDSLRTENVAEETSSTATTNGLYSVREVDTPEGLSTLVRTAPTARHDVWWGPCGSCHVPDNLRTG